MAVFGRDGNQVQLGFVKYGLPHDKAGNLVVGLAEPNAVGMVLNS